MSLNNISAQTLPEETQQVLDAISALGVDEMLAFLYYVYEKMGKSVTPAAPAAAEPELAPILLGDFFSLSDEDQLAAMREIAGKEKTEYSRMYGSLSQNNQLLVWYAWAQGMGDTVIGMPGNYQPVKAITDALTQVEKLEFQEQISLLREVASQMGHTDVQPIPTQAETGKTPSL